VPLQTLTVEEVCRIHSALVQEFAHSASPIYPPGVKSESLLSSAVSRQHTSIGNTPKYPDAFSSAATLAFGITCDHPFHNGNKRTALVSLLAHLYKNRLTLDQVREADLFNLVISIATHAVASTDKRSRHSPDRPPPDDEVTAIAHWLKQHSRSIQRGERPVTYRQLKRILESFGVSLRNPKGNAIDVYKQITTYDLIMRAQLTWIRIGAIPYPGDGELVSVKDLKYVRRLCGLTAENGVDSEQFYGAAEPLDAFIIQHRSILNRLGNR
jgi:death-on-curing protein